MESNLENKILISIVVPCYNAKEDLLVEALKSIREQSYKSFEIIVIDDGSAEEYHNILVKHIDRENERLITIDKSGVSEARNIGIQEARGDYICFIDADDLVSSDFLSRAVFYQQLTDADFIIGGVEQHQDRSEIKCSTLRNQTIYQLYNASDLALLVPHFIGSKFMICFPGGYISRGPVARLIRKGLANKIGFDKTITIGEDLVWNQRILREEIRVCVVKECWYHYWSNPESKTHKQDDFIFFELEKQIYALWDILDTEETMVYKSLIEHHFESLHTCWDLCLSKLKKKDKKKYRETAEYIYKSKIWEAICCKRTYKISTMKRKIVILLCRMRGYFFLLAMKDLLQRIIMKRQAVKKSESQIW